MVEFRVPKLSRWSAGLTGLERRVDKAVLTATSFAAKDYVAAKSARIDRDIDRPTQFTRRAYDWDKAQPGPDGAIASRSFIKPIAAGYMDDMEFGRTVQRQGEVGPVAIDPAVTDRYGGGGGANWVRRRFLNRTARSVATRKAKATGGGRVRRLRVGTVRYALLQGREGRNSRLVRKTKVAGGWELDTIATFLPSGRYRATLNFRADAQAFAPEFQRKVMRGFVRAVEEALD